VHAMLTRIAHTTDFSEASAAAFAHALRLAVAARCRLDILHVRQTSGPEAWHSFPRVREVLQRWAMLERGAVPEDIENRLGLRVAKVSITGRDPQVGISEFLLSHRPDLIVIATHGREGLNRWLSGSVSDDAVRRTSIPTLIIGPQSRGFVDLATGELSLRRVLMPVVGEPPPSDALKDVVRLLAAAQMSSDRVELVSVGYDLGAVLDDAGRALSIDRLDGPVVETIVKTAIDRGADLIAMPTTGRHGFIDAFRGSTTSRVVAHAPCPLLTLPMASA